MGALRCGVVGRDEFMPLYKYLAFFSDGFNICRQGRKRESWLRREERKQEGFPLPGMSTWANRLRSSCRQHYRIRRNSLAPRRAWPAGDAQRTHNHPQRPEIDIKYYIYYTYMIHTHPLTWCARQIKSSSCRFKNLDTTSTPKVKLTPRSFSPQPCTSLSGSLQSRSHSSPVSGTSVGRIRRRICSIPCRSGLRPPWQQKIFSSMMAATGRQLKQSVKVFQSLTL